MKFSVHLPVFVKGGEKFPVQGYWSFMAFLSWGCGEWPRSKLHARLSGAAELAGQVPTPSSWLPLSARFEAIHHELNKATAQNKDLQWEMELLQSELTELRTTQAKTAKESEKYKEERDAVYSEYKLIMSERDQVISELDKLQTEVELAESKLKSSTSEKKAASEEMEALRQVGRWRGKTGCDAQVSGVAGSSLQPAAAWVIGCLLGNC